MKNGTKIKTRARVSLDKDDNNNIIHAGRSGRDLRLSNRNATTGKPFETASGVHTLSRENNQYAPRPRRINRVRRKSYSNGVTHKRSYGDDGRTRTDLFDSTARSNTICRVPRCWCRPVTITDWRAARLAVAIAEWRAGGLLEGVWRTGGRRRDVDRHSPPVTSPTVVVGNCYQVTSFDGRAVTAGRETRSFGGGGGDARAQFISNRWRSATVRVRVPIIIPMPVTYLLLLLYYTNILYIHFTLWRWT